MLKLNLEAIFDTEIGNDNGLNKAAFNAALDQAADIPKTIVAEYEAGDLHQYIGLTDERAILDDIRNVLARQPYETLVILGIGGSALGNRMIVECLASPEQCETVIVLDNIDPEQISFELEKINPSKTLFNIITKSGSTTESMALGMIFVDAIQQSLGDRWTEHLVISTGENRLQQWAQENGVACLAIPEKVGGRFSVLSAVGLLTSEFLNIDSAALLDGAKSIETHANTASAHDNGMLQFGCAMQQLNRTKQKSQLVMMPYANRLQRFSDWFGQLWAESLGKICIDENGHESFVGQTPISALGATDQHSQIQLYTQGPADKVVVFFELEKFRTESIIPNGSLAGLEGVDFLRGKTLNEVMHAELVGTRAAITKASRPSMVFSLTTLDARTLGQLIAFFEYAVTYSGSLYGINAYDQPGVEQGKISAYALLGRAGYESERASLRAIEDGPEPKTLHID